ncbi:PREDICTED: T-complex protein 1 subunit delta-like [Acropora digitifera]|uniref:T-complex protein 1 subunit delta-like n=1 Tax=Acropora digitifera TaxID=70779 RepID=UPI00077A6DC3|nr:PREDICTED: T-complex protein 1 subunit delta-like [Acropora digitifera]
MPEAPAKTNNASSGGGNKQGAFKDKDKPTEIRMSNITAAKAVADAIRTSLGPKGMDKMIQSGNGDVTITNDGATILKQMQVLHPAARMYLAQKWLGIHPTTISESFEKAAAKALEMLTAMSTPVALSDRESLLKSAMTSLSSKVANWKHQETKKLRNNQKEGASSLLIDKDLPGYQSLLPFMYFQMENQVVVSDYTQMDRVLREERQYILDICKKIKKAGCNVLLIQKSILRDAISDLALHFLNKMKILVVRDIERDEIEFICKSLGCKPIASIDHFTPEMMATAELVEEVSLGTSKVVKVTGITNPGQTVSILVRGSNKLVLEEAERSLHDALCVVRCLVKKRALIAGGGAPEIEVSIKLAEHARTLTGMEAYCVRAFAEALEIIPYTLAENAGLNPIATVTELRNRHAKGETTAGINVRKGTITNILEENVLQPLLVSTSAIQLASETVRSILKIDDIVNKRIMKESDFSVIPARTWKRRIRLKISIFFGNFPVE